MTDISEEPSATLIVRMLFTLLISQYRSTFNRFIKIRNLYGFLLMTKRITILQTGCPSFVCWDNYSIHSTNITSVKIRKQYDFLTGTVQNGLIYLYELNSTNGLNNRTLDRILRRSVQQGHIYMEPGSLWELNRICSRAFRPHT